MWKLGIFYLFFLIANTEQTDTEDILTHLTRTYQDTGVGDLTCDYAKLEEYGEQIYHNTTELIRRVAEDGLAIVVYTSYCLFPLDWYSCMKSSDVNLILQHFVDIAQSFLQFKQNVWPTLYLLGHEVKLCAMGC